MAKNTKKSYVSIADIEMGRGVGELLALPPLKRHPILLVSLPHRAQSIPYLIYKSYSPRTYVISIL